METTQLVYEPIHNFFGLSYANYFVIPRSVLQSMPEIWQKKFVDLVNEIDVTLEINLPKYSVRAINEKNKFCKCPYSDYERGRRRIATKR